MFRVMLSAIVSSVDDYPLSYMYFRSVWETVAMEFRAGSIRGRLLVSIVVAVCAHGDGRVANTLKAYGESMMVPA